MKEVEVEVGACEMRMRMRTEICASLLSTHEVHDERDEHADHKHSDNNEEHYERHPTGGHLLPLCTPACKQYHCELAL